MFHALCSSVDRAGPVFLGRWGLVREDDDTYCGTFFFAPKVFNRNDVGKRAKRALTEYMRAFLQENGWRVVTLKINAAQAAVVIRPSNPASNFTRNW